MLPFAFFNKVCQLKNIVLKRSEGMVTFLFFFFGRRRKKKKRKKKEWLKLCVTPFAIGFYCLEGSKSSLPSMGISVKLAADKAYASYLSIS